MLEQDIKKSGLSKNDYIVRLLINRIDQSAVTCERKYFSNGVDIHFKIGNRRIGYASCLYFQNINKIQISSLYVTKPFQDTGIEEELLQKIQEYAALKKAASIIAYPGAEPYCPTEWKSLEMQTQWYKDQGFKIDHMVYNATPCMIKDL